MAILAAPLYPSVRRALGPDVDSALLPDALIGDPLYAAAADDDVLAVVPAAATVLSGGTDDDKRHVQSAAVLFCAARLAPLVPQYTEQHVGTLGASRKAQDWGTVARRLRQRAYDELGRLSPAAQVVTGALPGTQAQFVQATGGRGR